MSSQLDLEIGSQAPEVTPEEIEQLCAFLKGRGWVKAAVIEAEIRMDERKVRKVAEHSDGRIMSGPGCPGYKLLTGATEIDEVDQVASRLESQARKMLMRGASIRRRYHRFCRQ